MKRKAMAVLLVIIVIAGGLFWLTVSQRVLGVAQTTLAEELTVAFGAPITIGEMEVSSLSSITIHGVSVLDRQGRTVARGETVTVTYNPFKILRGHTPASAILTIAVERPQLFLETDRDGRWNAAELFQRSRQGDDSDFNGILSLAQGSTIVRTAGSEWGFENLAGMLDFTAKPTVAIDISAEANGAQVRVTGNFSSHGRGALVVTADSLRLTDYQPLLPQNGSFQLQAGSADTVEVAVSWKSDELHYSGSGVLNNADITVGSVPITAAKGLVAFNEKSIDLHNLAQVYGQPIAVTGKITTGIAESVLDLVVSSDGFEFAEVDRSLPVTGKTTFSARVTGLETAPIVEGTIRLAEGMIGDCHLYDAQAKLRVVMSPSSRIPREAEVIGTVAAGGGVYRGLSFTQANTSFHYAGGKLTADYINAEIGQGEMTASGAVTGDALSFDLRGHNVPLGLLTVYFPGLDADGAVDFNGHIAGTTERPELVAAFKAKNSRLLYQPFDTVSGRSEITPEKAVFQDVNAVHGVTQHTVNGAIIFLEEPQVDLRIATRRARAENMVKLLAPTEKLTGNIDNDITIKGQLHNPEVQGKIILTEGSFRGRLVNRIEGAYNRTNGITTFDAFRVDYFNAQIRASGQMSIDNSLDIDVVARGIDIGRLNLRTPYQVDGQGDFTGKLTGTVATPIFIGQLMADKIKLNNQVITGIAGSIEISKDTIMVPEFSFHQGDGKFQFFGGINTETNQIDGSFAVEKGDLTSLLTLLNIPVKQISGRLDGTVRIDGVLHKPNIRVNGALTAGKIKNYPLDNIDVDVALENNLVTINRLEAKQGLGVLAIRGTAELDGSINMEAGGQGIDAGLLTAWLDSDLDTKGKLNFAAQISGKTLDPHADISMEITGGGVSTATFDSLYGMFIVDGGNIHVRQLLLTKGQYRASAYGQIPLAALNTVGRKQATDADSMDLKIRLDEANLSILPLLTKEVSWATGQTQGVVTVAGTLTNPLLNGNVTIRDATIKLAALSDPIQKMGLDIGFDGDKINLKTFEGYSGSGSYQLAGTAVLRGLSIGKYDLTLNFNELGIANKYFTGPLNGELRLAGKGERPELSGKLYFERDIINIPYVAEVSPTDINIGLDLELDFGKKVRFYNPYMYDILAEGRVRFTGTTQLPIASGQIGALRGTVSYLNTRFVIKEARADFIQYGSFQPVVNLVADTKLERTTVTLAVNGPLNTMTFRLTSDPAMNQREILSLLTLRSRYYDRQNGNSAPNAGIGRDEMLTLLDSGLQMRFVSELESSFRKAVGVDEFHLVKNTLSSEALVSDPAKPKQAVNDREVYNLEFGKYINDRLLINYTMGVDHNLREVGLRYDLNKRFSLTGSIDEQNRSRFGLETRFKF